MTPFCVKNKYTGESTPVPCGKCPACRKRRTSAWSFRLMQEQKRSISAYFITLTYGTTHAPITKNGFMDLSKRDVQLFLKRLRKDHETHWKKNNLDGQQQPPIRYYLVGEFGGRTSRPHYHALIFNAVLELIQPAWQKGQIHYGEVTNASVGYTLKYMSKTSKIPLHRNDDRTPEFSLMSKKLGSNYLTPEMILWHHKNLTDRMYCTIEGGKKISMPRYYKEKIYSKQQQKAIGVKARTEQEKRKEKINYADQAQAHLAAFRKAKKDEKLASHCKL